METILNLIIPAIFGAIGYLIAVFWFRPILRYKDIKYQIAQDLVFFANAIDPGVHNRAKDRMDENRHRAAELKAIYSYLPMWYKTWLKKLSEYPLEAYPELIGLGNTQGPDEANKRIEKIRKYLRLS